MSDRIVYHARRWLNGPLPSELIADLADIVEDEDYTAEKRAHQIVWQAMKWMLENPVEQNGNRTRKAERGGGTKSGHPATC